MKVAMDWEGSSEGSRDIDIQHQPEPRGVVREKESRCIVVCFILLRALSLLVISSVYPSPVFVIDSHRINVIYWLDHVWATSSSFFFFSTWHKLLGWSDVETQSKEWPMVNKSLRNCEEGFRRTEPFISGAFCSLACSWMWFHASGDIYIHLMTHVYSGISEHSYRTQSVYPESEYGLLPGLCACFLGIISSTCLTIVF